jgi:hypothetical protein
MNDDIRTKLANDAYWAAWECRFEKEYYHLKPFPENCRPRWLSRLLGKVPCPKCRGWATIKCPICGTTLLFTCWLSKIEAALYKVTK